MPAAARFNVAHDVNWRDAPGEILLFDARTDCYCVLSEEAAAVWRRLAAGAPLDEVATDLARRYDAEPAVLLADVTDTAEDLLRRGLIVAASPG